MNDAVATLVEEHPEAEVQTDKPVGKVVPCTECGRELVVNQFYAPAIAKCSSCKGETGATGSVVAPQPGKTEPAKAEDLTKTLVNPAFARALCPVHPEDPEHEMELKSVNHNDEYGPSELIGYRANGIPEYRQTEIGETVMHQCLKCRAVVTYSTTAQTQFRRVNEARPGKHVNGWAGVLGTREPA